VIVGVPIVTSPDGSALLFIGGIIPRPTVVGIVNTGTSGGLEANP
jgi:hypothetical protein